MPRVGILNIYLLATVWCFVPLAWGLWAMLAPAAWVPQRFPLWGSLLGLLAGIVAALVLNVPSRVAGASVPLALRILDVVAIMAFYYFLWMLVRGVYQAIAGRAPKAETAPPEKKAAA